jgi:hypothetical protein
MRDPDTEKMYGTNAVVLTDAPEVVYSPESEASKAVAKLTPSERLAQYLLQSRPENWKDASDELKQRAVEWLEVMESHDLTKTLINSNPPYFATSADGEDVCIEWSGKPRALCVWVDDDGISFTRIDDNAPISDNDNGIFEGDAELDAAILRELLLWLNGNE